MNPFERITRLVDIHQLIKQEKTGSPAELAKKLRISRSQLYNVIEELEDYGALIKYSRKKETFYYNADFELSETKFWKKEVEGFYKKNLSIQG
jgi:predicted DNA-binding transcriptional regulator YafY